MGTTTAKRKRSPEQESAVSAQTPGAKAVNGSCHNCGSMSRCRRRQFSEQAWTVLLLWNEINPSAVDQPICSDCYEEMRDILIDRTDEIETAMQQSDEVAKIKIHLNNLAS